MINYVGGISYITQAHSCTITNTVSATIPHGRPRGSLIAQMKGIVLHIMVG